MDLGQIDVFNIIGAVIIADLAARPINTFNLVGSSAGAFMILRVGVAHFNDLTVFNLASERDIRVPAVMQDVLLVGGLL